MPTRLRPAARAAMPILVAVVVLLLPACQVTLREPEVQPVNPVVILPTELQPTCNQVRSAIGFLGGSLEEEIVERDACLFESAYLTLESSGRGITRLDDVAYVGTASVFSRGRYKLTVSARPTTDGNTRLRLTTRIEGFDGDYRVLRSRGLIERTIVERITTVMDVEPVDPGDSTP